MNINIYYNCREARDLHFFLFPGVGPLDEKNSISVKTLYCTPLQEGDIVEIPDAMYKNASNMIEHTMVIK